MKASPLGMIYALTVILDANRENVDCFSEYDPEIKMNPDGVHVI